MTSKGATCKDQIIRFEKKRNAKVLWGTCSAKLRHLSVRYSHTHIVLGCAARCAPEERRPPRSASDDRNLKPSSTSVSGLLGVFLYFLTREGVSSLCEIAMCDLSSFEERARLWSDMASHDRNKKLLLELVKRPDNSRCADCGAPGKRRSSVRSVMLKFRYWRESLHFNWSQIGSVFWLLVILWISNKLKEIWL